MRTLHWHTHAQVGLATLANRRFALRLFIATVAAVAFIQIVTVNHSCLVYYLHNTGGNHAGHDAAAATGVNGWCGDQPAMGGGGMDHGGYDAGGGGMGHGGMDMGSGSMDGGMDHGGGMGSGSMSHGGMGSMDGGSGMGMGSGSM